MKNLKILAVLAVFLNTQLGICDQVAPLNKGEPAPFNGYIIDQDKLIKVRDLAIDLDTQKKVNTNLTQENSLMNERLVNSQKQDEFLSKQLVETRDSGFISKVGFFVLGAAITGLVSYGIYKSR